MKSKRRDERESWTPQTATDQTKRVTVRQVLLAQLVLQREKERRQEVLQTDYCRRQRERVQEQLQGRQITLVPAAHRIVTSPGQPPAWERQTKSYPVLQRERELLLGLQMVRQAVRSLQIRTVRLLADQRAMVRRLERQREK